MRIHREQHLVADGWERLVASHRPRIEEEIRARYALSLESASLFERWQIALRIRAEVRQALAEVAPAEALY